MNPFLSPILGKPVVVVEDDLALGGAIAEELRGQGIAVRLSHSVVEGARAARSRETACLVLDCPPSGDDDHLALVRRLRAEGNTTPIVLVSDKTSVRDRIAALRAGSDDYVLKPVSKLCFAGSKTFRPRGSSWRGSNLTLSNAALPQTAETSNCSRANFSYSNICFAASRRT